MKVAVATDDFVNVTGHVGRCNGFLVFEIEEGKIVNVENRENNFTNHKRSEHHSHDHGRFSRRLIRLFPFNLYGRWMENAE